MPKQEHSAALDRAAQLSRQILRAEKRAEGLKPERDAAILEAIRAGDSYRTIAAKTGLGLARVGQIAKAKEQS
jgi:DNA-binding NarL/FixJ family response regulator